MVSWLLTGAPEQRYWQNRETANVGLDSSVGRAPARQSGGRRFKSRSSQFFFVHPNLSEIKLCWSYAYSCIHEYSIFFQAGKILTASWVAQNALQVWDIATGRLEQSVPLSGNDKSGEFLYCAQFCDNNVVVAGGSGTCNAQAINGATNQVGFIRFEALIGGYRTT